MPLQIQLAIQGGGARIVPLLAALEKIQELQQKGRIKVTRVAGTSAGAIVGCLFAAGCPLGEVRTYLEGTSAADLARAFPRPSGYVDMGKMFWKLYSGKALWNTAPIHKALTRFLEQQDVFTLDDIKTKKGVEVFVVAADLVNSQMKPHMGSEPIVNAVLDSCAIPFAFRNFQSPGNAGIIDGGICENLPSEVLESYAAKDGPVVGIALGPQPGQPAKNLLEFSAALLNTAIGNSMHRARRRLGTECVCSIKTGIDTFEFEKALREGFGESYQRVHRDVEDFFKGFIEKRKALLRTPDPWNITDQNYRELIEKLGDIFHVQHESTKFRYRRCRLEVQANCLLDEGEDFYGNPDFVNYSLEFQTLEEPIFCHRIGLSQADHVTFLNKTDIEILDAAGNAIEAIRVPSRDAREPTKRGVLLFFNPPLVGNSGPYSVRFRDLVTNFLLNVRTEGKDDLRVTSSRADGPIGSIDLVLHVPNRYGDLRMQAKEDSPTGRAMTKPELKEYTTPIGFRSLGWRGEAVNPAKTFEVDVLLGTPPQGVT